MITLSESLKISLGLQLFYRQFAKLLSPAGLYIMIWDILSATCSRAVSGFYSHCRSNRCTQTLPPGRLLLSHSVSSVSALFSWSRRNSLTMHCLLASRLARSSVAVHTAAADSSRLLTCTGCLCRCERCTLWPVRAAPALPWSRWPRAPSSSGQPCDLPAHRLLRYPGWHNDTWSPRLSSGMWYRLLAPFVLRSGTPGLWGYLDIHRLALFCYLSGSWFYAYCGMKSGPFLASDLCICPARSVRLFFEAPQWFCPVRRCLCFLWILLWFASSDALLVSQQLPDFEAKHNSSFVLPAISRPTSLQGTQGASV